jgi:pyruvate,orthophosphate dikinase
MSKRQVVHLLDEVRTADPVVLGGKGRGLAEMVALGLPVPPGFVITTTVSRAFGATGRFPKRTKWHLDRGMLSLERASGKRFGATVNPLLVSVRSGAPVSMPGMMDTILNLGMTDAIAETMAKQYGDEFAEDCRSRFFSMFGAVTQGDEPIRIIPENPAEQLEMAICAVVRSWMNPRAVAYRAANSIPDWHGTAVVIQEMVFGNADEQSCSGVVFSRNITTGQPGLYGEFLVNAQGEDVVSGRSIGRPISELRDWSDAVYSQLSQYAQKLEQHYGHVVDIEFTVQSGRLYLLQVRAAKMTPLAIVTAAVHDVHNGVRTKEDIVATATDELVQRSAVASFGPPPTSAHLLLATGLPVSPGAVVGKLAFSSTRAIEMAKSGESVVLFRHDTTPDDLEGMLASKAIITANGGATCHAAVVARGMNIVAVVGCEALTTTDVAESGLMLSVPQQAAFPEGTVVSVDGTNGKIYNGAMPLMQSSATKEQALFTKWVKQLRPELLETPPIVNWGSRMGTYDASRLLSDFYLSDAMAAAAKGTALAADAESLRATIHVRTAELLACYLIHAVWGELRHIWDRTSTTIGMANNRAELIQRLADQFGFDRVRGERMSDRSWAQQYAEPALGHRPVSEVAEFADLAMTAFDNFRWPSSYGGPKWGEIARTLRDYLRGTLTHTVFVDHVFDLEHNGGQLFDKHRMLDQTSAPCVKARLNDKRRATSITELYLVLHLFSPTIQDLYDRGVKMNLWSYNMELNVDDPYLPH